MKIRHLKLLAVLLLITTCACTTLHAVKPNDEMFYRAKVLHVTLISTEEYVLRDSRVQEDSLVAMAWKKKDFHSTTNIWNKEKIAFHMGMIQSMKAEVYDGQKTLIFSLSTITFLGVFFYFVKAISGLGELR